MASEEVIELGSSEDEAEPAPKKAKPMPNTMVHIPHKIADVTIQPVKNNLPRVNRKMQGKSITIKKNSRASVNPCSVGVLGIGKVRNPVGKQIVKTLQKPMQVKQGLNPISLKLNNSQTVINKVTSKYFIDPKKSPRIPGLAISSLPSSLTIKKNTPTQKYVSQNTGNKLNKNIKVINKVAFLPKVNLIPNINLMPKVTIMPTQACPKSSEGEVLTVELDDDDTNPECSKGPQWYLRPEEQEQKEKIKENNNAEPNTSHLIEITIEDSPVKPGKHNEIGAEYAITIEDSPMKLKAYGIKTKNCSDEESKAEDQQQPKTKKKLTYPNNDSAKTVEIEIEPMEVIDSSQEVSENIPGSSNNVETEANQKLNQNEEEMVTETPTNNDIAEESQLKSENSENQKQEGNEFHPVYQSFIDLCFKLENSDDMQKIVEKKIKGYYKQVSKVYTESEEFIDMVTSKISSIKAAPEKMYLYIKDVVDELNFQRKSLKNKVPTVQETKDTEVEKVLYGEESEFDSKRQRQIRRLEKTLKKLHRAIQKLEEQEVDFEDEEDSVYLLTERYKARMIRVHAKFCQLTNTKMPSEPRVHIEARPGQPTGPAKRLEKWINKKVPIGTPLPFPDFHDVLQCVREANKEDKLMWNEAEIMDEARDLFVRCGKKLQRRRQENEWRLAASRISLDVDPAKESAELKKKLEQNQLLAVKKETDLFNRYADKQKQMKLEAVEIGDKEAEESPVESEDDDSDEEDALLANTEKRKEGLKKLLQQKYAKDNEQKENKEINNPDNDVKKVDTSSDKTICKNNKPKTSEMNSESLKNINEDVQTLSDSSNINSDVDELHLLQKLHSEPEGCTSTMESDSASPIAISDNPDSGSESAEQENEDVISIENSSYSETELNETEKAVVDTQKCLKKEEMVEGKGNTNLEIDCSNFFNNGIDIDIDKKLNKSNNDEYNESVEDILLASTDEDTTDKVIPTGNDHIYVNLNDDTLSIEETVIVCNNTQNNKNDSSSNADTEVLVEKNNQLKDSQTTNDVMQNIINDLQKDDKAKKHVNDGNTNMPSALDANAVKTTSSISGNATMNSTYNATGDNIVGSSTETMEAVTTTSPYDGVNA